VGYGGICWVWLFIVGVIFCIVMYSRLYNQSFIYGFAVVLIVSVSLV